MIYRARTENDKVLIAMYETEEPRKFTTLANLSTTKEWDEWQSSKREYKVRESDRKEILDAIIDSIKFPGDMKDFYDSLVKGIDCTFLKDRLKLDDVHETIIGACRGEFEWTLLPLEDKKENEANKWISFKDRLPVDGKSYLFYTKGGCRILFYQEKGKFYYDENIWCDKITHWMPLPEPPTIQEPE